MGKRNVKEIEKNDMKKIFVLYTAIILIGGSTAFSQCNYRKESNTKFSLILLEFLDRPIEDINKLALVDLIDTEQEMYLEEKIDDRINSIGIYKFGILASNLS